MQLILISGLSGSGKSIALKILEDSGFYCVDNLPSPLLPNVVETITAYGYARIAISVDTRSAPMLPALPQVVVQLREKGLDLRLIFLDAKTDTLIKRFSETRRRHPLSEEGLTIPECIQRERAMLVPIHQISQCVDTSDLSANQLRSWMKQLADKDSSRLTVVVQSFGFKYGIPLDADFVFDVRCLSNPYYEPALREMSGQDASVAGFLAADPAVNAMFADIHGMVARWLPEFARDNRSYLTIAIGCTGGQHRSVYLADRLAAALEGGDEQVLVRHRQLFRA